MAACIALTVVPRSATIAGTATFIIDVSSTPRNMLRVAMTAGIQYRQPGVSSGSEARSVIEKNATGTPKPVFPTL